MTIWAARCEAMDREQLRALQLERLQGIEPYYQIVLERRGSLDTFEVHVEVGEALFNGWMDDLRAFEKQVTDRLRSALLVRPKVKLVEPGTLERTEGKARRVIDKRPRQTRRGADGRRHACITSALTAYVERPAVRAPASRRRPWCKLAGKPSLKALPVSWYVYRETAPRVHRTSV